MLLGTRNLTAWVAVNVIGSVAFLYFASWTWLEPNLRDEEVAQGGDALVWMLGAFPILVLAVVGNALWLVLASRARRASQSRWPVPPFVIVALVWTCALAVDRLRGAGF